MQLLYIPPKLGEYIANSVHYVALAQHLFAFLD